MAFWARPLSGPKLPLFLRGGCPVPRPPELFLIQFWWCRLTIPAATPTGLRCLPQASCPESPCSPLHPPPSETESWWLPEAGGVVRPRWCLGGSVRAAPGPKEVLREALQRAGPELSPRAPPAPLKPAHLQGEGCAPCGAPAGGAGSASLLTGLSSVPAHSPVALTDRCPHRPPSLCAGLGEAALSVALCRLPCSVCRLCPWSSRSQAAGVGGGALLCSQPASPPAFEGFSP